jgi:hypothetical protein
MSAVRFLLNSLLLALLAMLLFLFAIPLVLWTLAGIIWFRFKNRGKRFLVYTRRHGWNEFIENNLFPVFDHEVEAIEIPWGGRSPWPWRVSQIHSATFGRRKPFLADISWTGARCSELHDSLLPLKQHGARDSEVQAELRNILRGLLAGT